MLAATGGNKSRAAKILGIERISNPDGGYRCVEFPFGIAQHLSCSLFYAAFSSTFLGRASHQVTHILPADP